MHGLIEKVANTHRYRLTPLDQRVSLFFAKLNARILRPGLSQLFDACPKCPNRPLALVMAQLDRACSGLFEEAKPCA